MTNVNIILANELDFDEYVALQKETFAAHLEQYDVDSSYLKPAYFAWKYMPPSGNAKIAAVYDGNDMIAATAAIPVWIGNTNNRVRMWRAVDIATRPAARGRGLFTKILRALIDSMEENEVFSSFPNKNSTPGFLKIGSIDAATVPTWVRPVLPGKIFSPLGRKITDFSTLESDALNRLLIPDMSTAVIRDMDYMSWRYSQHPVYEYQAYMCERNENQTGLIVFRKTRVYGRDVLNILEWWANDNNTRAHLLKFAITYCRKHNIHLMITVNNSFSMLQGSRHQFIYVPQQFVPKKQVLRGCTSGEKAARIFLGDWVIHMGDLFEF